MIHLKSQLVQLQQGGLEQQFVKSDEQWEKLLPTLSTSDNLIWASSQVPLAIQNDLNPFDAFVGFLSESSLLSWTFEHHNFTEHFFLSFARCLLPFLLTVTIEDFIWYFLSSFFVKEAKQIKGRPIFLSTGSHCWNSCCYYVYSTRNLT